MTTPPSPLRPCSLCERGPHGIAGHDELFSQTMGSTHMLFRCRQCGSAWVRRQGANGAYSWTAPAGEPKGMDTPGRPGTAPP